MNIENHLALRMYQLVLAIRDSVEYCLGNASYQPHIYYMRKQFFESSLKEGPFVDMLKANKEHGEKIYNNLYSLYNDLFVKSIYLKVEDDRVSLFEDADTYELLERLLGNYFIVSEILDYNIKVYKDVASEIKDLLVTNNNYFAVLYAYVLIVNILEKKNNAILNKDIDGYRKILSLYYFFKEKAHPTDDDLIASFKKIDHIIDILEERVSEDLVSEVTKLYKVLDSLVKECEKTWQDSYGKVIELFKAESNL